MKTRYTTSGDGYVNKLICPRDCPGRNATCHATCERYKQFREEQDRTLAEKYRINDADGAKIESVKRMKTIRKRRKT